MEGRLLHVIGPSGWVQTENRDYELKRALTLCGALRTLTAAQIDEIAPIYGDPLSNRAFAFLDAIIGPKNALIALGRLKNLRIGIVGCGGIGSVIAYLLAGMGAKKFVLIDPDIVERGNLSRQVLFTLRQIGKLKTDALSNSLKDRFEGLQAMTIPENSLSKNSIKNLQRADVVICTADDPPDLAEILYDRLGHNQNLWSCGYLFGVSAIKNHRVRRTNKHRKIIWRKRQGEIAPSIGFQNFEVAARVVALLVLSLASEGQPKTDYMFDYRSLRGRARHKSNKR